MNPKVRVLAYIYIALCSLVLVAGLVLCAGLFFGVVADEPNAARTFGTIGMPFLILSIAYFIPGLAGGIGLLKGLPWARTVIILLSVLVLFAIPIGTIFGAFGLWVLLSAPAAPPSSGTSRTATIPPSPKPTTAEDRSRYIGILIAMAGVASLFIVMIGTGYRVTNDPSSPIGDPLYYAGIVVLAAFVGFGVRAFWRWASDYYWKQWSPSHRRRERETIRKWQNERNEWLARLAADPVRRKYVERVEQNEFSNDEQIDYFEYPHRLATCEHLQPIERAIRDGGITVHLRTAPDIAAECVVDPVALARRFQLPESVHYDEPMMYDDRGVEDPMALIHCDACRSVIHVQHPRRAPPDTSVFPIA